jgi:ubiquinone/menaquinone biosynthesis C-methylase UbiE
MKQINRINVHDEFASTYDSKAREYDSHGPEIVFGMCYEYIHPGETILDLGIGTGLSSINFARAGLLVHGMDASAGMLAECRKKGFAKELKQHSLELTPLPYSDNSFPFVICCGVFHFFAELQSFLSEVSRIVQPKGMFAFTFALPSPDELSSISIDREKYIEVKSEWDVPVFKHKNEYICELMDTYHLQILKQQRVLAKSGEKKLADIIFKTIVTQKQRK